MIVGKTETLESLFLSMTILALASISATCSILLFVDLFSSMSGEAAVLLTLIEDFIAVDRSRVWGVFIYDCGTNGVDDAG